MFERWTTSQAHCQVEVWVKLGWNNKCASHQRVLNRRTQLRNSAKVPNYYFSVLNRCTELICPEFWLRKKRNRKLLCYKLHLSRGRWTNLASRIPYACHSYTCFLACSRVTRIQGTHRADQMWFHADASPALPHNLKQGRIYFWGAN